MVAWLSRRLGMLYADLYRRFGGEGFTSSDVADLLGGDGAARVALLRLRKAGAVFVHEKTHRGWVYRLADPDAYVLSVAGALQSLEKIPQQRYSRLVGIYCVEALRNVKGLRSVVVFGSVARGDARVDSDVDLLVVLDGFESLGEAVDMLVNIEYSPRVVRELEWLEEKGISTHLSFHPVSGETFRKHPPIMLDAVEDGIAVVDDGTYRREAWKMKARMKELGAARIWLTDEEWVWVLKPDAKIGEVIEL
ncbi:MAG: nucleotidyltransferase domain-containing protein [Candidatus Caldarchaeum sp.]|nr:nucleotidyltransferase domain-containing protein [Candidatus Caldarchaeum sp.]